MKLLIHLLLLASCGASALAQSGRSKPQAVAAIEMAQHFPARVVSSAGLATPTNQRAPFGWECATITSADKAPLVLKWDALPEGAVPTHLRIAVGLDERDEKEVEVFLPKSGRVVGTMDLRFVSQFQLYQLALTPADVADIRREGVALRLTKGSDLEIFTVGADIPAALLPHLLVPGTARAMDEFFARMNSLACVQQFGWMEGCVLDGLMDLSMRPAHAELRKSAERHLSLFFKNGQLVYENHVSAPSDGKLYGIEGGTPFGALARLQPQSSLPDLAIEFWKSRKRPTGSIQDGVHMSSEGAYTIGYALAEIAKARKSEPLMTEALNQVRLRQAQLFDGREFWRTYNDDGKRGNRNWARGIAWQILGLARTLEVAKDHQGIQDLVIQLQRMSAWVIAMQRADGLWSVFADEANLTPDTAGSAGIAAALAIGVKNGWLDAKAEAAARKTLAGLQTHLTSDGFLGGVSQSNKGGEALQRGDYRSIYQMGMGLMAQLIAALESSETPVKQAARDPWLWPFASDSIWNMPIGSRAVYQPANLQPAKHVGVDTQILLRTSAMDPEAEVIGSPSFKSRSTGSNSLGFKLRVPNAWTVPDAGKGNPYGLTPNACYAILLPDGVSVLQGACICRPQPGGPVYLPAYMKFGNNRTPVRLKGDGLGKMGQGASGLSTLGGTLRLGELVGDEPIRHVIKLNPFAARYCFYSKEIPGWRWPAHKADSYAPGQYKGTNSALVMGTLLALKPDARPESLGLQTKAGRKLFQVLQDYGAYFTEDAAWDTWDLIVERDAEKEFEQAHGFSMKSPMWRDEVNRLVIALQIVENNSPQTHGGGGIPRRPLAPAFSQDQ